MLESYLGIIIAFAVVVIVGWILSSVLKRSEDPAQTLLGDIKPTSKTDARISQRKDAVPEVETSPQKKESGTRAATPVSISNEVPAYITNLRRNLLQKVLGDQAKVERLIEYERNRNPTASLAVWMRAAVDRWEHDNR